MKQLRKLLAALFTLTAIMLFMVPAYAQMYRVTGNDINVREKNSSKSKVVGSVSSGINVLVLDSISDKDFYKVKLTNGEGWVSKKFLEKIVEAPQTQAVTTAPATATQPQPNSALAMYKVTGDNINVRETNSSKARVVGSVSTGENVVVTDSVTDDTFFKVKLTNGEGWMSKKFLEKLPPPIAKASTKSLKVVAPKVTTSNDNLIFLSIVTLVLIGMLIIIFRFLKSNVSLMIFATLVVLAVGYFSFTLLFLKKTVSGKYITNSDNQYQSFEFKPNHLVAVQDNYADSVFTASYEIEGDMVKFKQQENIFMLLIMDDSTLVGEGFIKGTFVK